MRALYLSDLTILDEYNVTGDSLHHLVNVVRIKKDEELLLLNGAGLKVKARVSILAKRNLTLSYISSEQSEKKVIFDVAIGMPKRDALELCLKQAVELGMDKIYLIKSDYSQMKSLEDERTQSLLISGLEQSNAAFIPKVFNLSWKDIAFNDYQAIVMMDSQTENTGNFSRGTALTGPILLVIGPEGGFSPAERELLMATKNVKILKLPTPILRTPTALAAGAGIVWETLLK